MKKVERRAGLLGLPAGLLGLSAGLLRSLADVLEGEEASDETPPIGSEFLRQLNEAMRDVVGDDEEG